MDNYIGALIGAGVRVITNTPRLGQLVGDDATPRGLDLIEDIAMDASLVGQVQHSPLVDTMPAIQRLWEATAPVPPTSAVLAQPNIWVSHSLCSFKSTPHQGVIYFHVLHPSGLLLFFLTFPN